MKIRTDFVTNSSSSSFLIARSEEFNEKQKEAIIKFVGKRMFGKMKASTKEELDKIFVEYSGDDPDELLEEDNYHHSEYMDALEAIDKGLVVSLGWVNFDNDDYANMLIGLWNEIESADEERFIQIDTSLEY